jgi:hypothetical protein
MTDLRISTRESRGQRLRDWAVPFECLRVKELRVTEESGEEGLSGGGDGLALGFVEAAEERWERAGVGEGGEGDGFVEDADRVDGVAEVFEWLEAGADGFGGGPIGGLAGVEHGGGEGWVETAAAGGEAGEVTVAEVVDDWLFAHAADDERGVDEVEERGEEGVVGFVRADDGVLDP